MSAQLSTTNMAEALHLLRRHNRMVKVRMECTWPYGHEECAVVFEGADLEADHIHFLTHMADYDLSGLPELFEAITAVLPQKGGTA
jgi:hypothetical protein